MTACKRGATIRRFPGNFLLAALGLLLSFSGSTSMAQESLSPRLQIGTSILPGIIAANKRLTDDDSQTLQIYLVYRDNLHQAEQLRTSLQKIDRIRKRKLQVESISLANLTALHPPPTSAIFIVEPLGDDLDKLLEFGKRRKLLLFSPFEGDVERGVATGFRVTDKVLPMVNMGALKQTNIQLKAFFLRIAVKHE